MTKEQIKTLIIPTTWLPKDIAVGYGNGYIGVPPEHPWYGKDYDSIDCDIHGGLTYGRDHAPSQEPDGLWWIGFDTCHYQDNQYNCSQVYVEQQVQSLVEQALKAVN